MPVVKNRRCYGCIILNVSFCVIFPVRLYWADQAEGTIRYINLDDGSTGQQMLPVGEPPVTRAVYDVAIFQVKLKWYCRINDQ